MRQALSTLEADGILAIGDEVDVCSPASSTLASWGNATNCNASNEISSHEQIFWITVTASVLTTTSKASMAGISECVAASPETYFRLTSLVQQLTPLERFSPLISKHE